MSLKVIALELARNPGAPHGDTAHGYIFRAPLDTKGQFDSSQWPRVKQFCTVKRIEKGTEVEAGLLVLSAKGRWAFSYTPGDDDDETLFRLAGHRFIPGDYVSITEHDGVERTFKVRSVADWLADGALAS